MNAKKVKRKCGMRGCKNTASYHLSKTREMGNSIIICEDCLRDALETITGQKWQPIDETNTPEQTEITKTDEPIEKTYICSRCGREFLTENGMKTHMRTCKVGRRSEAAQLAKLDELMSGGA